LGGIRGTPLIHQLRAYLEKLAAFAGARGIGDTHVLGRFLRDVAKLNSKQRNFRVFRTGETSGR
jgi:xylulose-5-phosphate/fructose-6-phosphate phosphoketolase